MATNEGKRKGGKNAARGARQAAQTRGDRPRKVHNGIERKVARATKSCGKKYSIALRKYLTEKHSINTKHFKCGTRFYFVNAVKQLKREAYFERVRKSHLIGNQVAIKIATQ